MARKKEILARRLGKTVHVSPLRFKLQRLAVQFPAEQAEYLEDWLIDLANARGARIVRRSIDRKNEYIAPAEQLVSNEELVVPVHNCVLVCYNPNSYSVYGDICCLSACLWKA